MARQRKITSFESVYAGQCFQIVGGTSGAIWEKRDKFTARCVLGASPWGVGNIIDVRKDQEVTRCLSPEQRERRMQKQVA